jgi:magnesium transporter
LPKRFKIKKHGEVGAAPGSISVPTDALEPRIFVFSCHESGCTEQPLNTIEDAFQYLKDNEGKVNWLQIKGMGDETFLRKIGDAFDLNPLVLEDISDTTQRPKYDEYDDYFFAISRLVVLNSEQQTFNTQLSLVVRKRMLISFQETYDEYFSGLKNRLKNSKTILREKDSGYLFYAILDTVFDRYFAILDQLEDALAELEDSINKKPRRRNMLDAQRIKRMLILLFKVTGPERDKMNEILRSDNPLISSKDKIYLRDAYDHCMDIIDIIHSQKELSTNLTDIYLSTINNQMNDVMRILTIVSAIFIPLSFIAGLYGMNFARVDPVTGKALVHNMPELYQPHGYQYTLWVMIFITVVQLIIFWRKGWFNRLK